MSPDQHAELVRCPECGHPTRRHIPHRLPADLWRCNYGACKCVVRWPVTAEEERHQHVWVDGKCQTCAARDPGDAEAIMRLIDGPGGGS